MNLFNTVKANACLRLCLLLLAGCVSTSGYACEYNHDSSPRNLPNYTCMLTAMKSHYDNSLSKTYGEEKRSPIPACVGQLQIAAHKDMLKTKACLKKEKNSDGLRALGEFWVDWSETIGSMSNPFKVDEVKGLYDEAIKKVKLLDVMM